MTLLIFTLCPFLSVFTTSLVILQGGTAQNNVDNDVVARRLLVNITWTSESVEQHLCWMTVSKRMGFSFVFALCIDRWHK